MKTNFTRGIVYTCLAAIWWGMPQPLFFDEIKYVPSLEVVMHRGVWSFLILFISTPLVSDGVSDYFPNKSGVFGNHLSIICYFKYWE